MTNIAGADGAKRAFVCEPHVAQEEEANEGQAVVQPIAELLVAMEQAAAELEAAATEQPAAEQLEVEQAVAEQPVPRVRLVMKPRDEATTRRVAEEQAAAVPLTSEQALQQAQAEGIRLRVGNNASGYFGVSLEASKSLPFRAQLKWSGQSEKRNSAIESVSFLQSRRSRTVQYGFKLGTQPPSHPSPRPTRPVRCERGAQRAADAVVR